MDKSTQDDSKRAPFSTTRYKQKKPTTPHCHHPSGYPDSPLKGRIKCVILKEGNELVKHSGQIIENKELLWEEIEQDRKGQTGPQPSPRQASL